MSSVPATSRNYLRPGVTGHIEKCSSGFKKGSTFQSRECDRKGVTNAHGTNPPTRDFSFRSNDQSSSCQPSTAPARGQVASSMQDRPPGNADPQTHGYTGSLPDHHISSNLQHGSFVTPVKATCADSSASHMPGLPSRSVANFVYLSSSKICVTGKSLFLCPFEDLNSKDKKVSCEAT